MTRCSRRIRNLGWLLGAVACWLFGAGTITAQAQEAGRSPRIYSCLDAKGKRITSDRPIPECLAREQRLHGLDGAVRGVVPPSLTAQEREVMDAERKRKDDERATLLAAARRDRQLMSSHPDEKAHDAARASALADVQRSLATTQKQLDLLVQERKALMQEADFFKGKALPPKLREKVEINEVSMNAKISGRQRLLAEEQRLQGILDIELERLRRLWAGAAPGSLGPLPTLPHGADTPVAAGSAPAVDSAKAKPAQ